MNTPLNTPNGTIVKIVSFSLSQRIPVRVVIIRVQNVSVRIMRLLNTGERSPALSWTG